MAQHLQAVQRRTAPATHTGYVTNSRHVHYTQMFFTPSSSLLPQHTHTCVLLPSVLFSLRPSTRTMVSVWPPITSMELVNLLYSHTHTKFTSLRVTQWEIPGNGCNSCTRQHVLEIIQYIIHTQRPQQARSNNITLKRHSQLHTAQNYRNPIYCLVLTAFFSFPACTKDQFSGSHVWLVISIWRGVAPSPLVGSQ